MAKCTADDVLESIDTWTVLDVHKLVKGIEEKYGVRFDSDQVIPSNFRSIEDIVSFVQNQLSMPQGQSD